ncbi:MAG: hypothetical protein AB7K24_11965 [Gemmataceae bacterium]
MTRLGKALVYLNLILSLGLATMALGIYTNRIDWAGKATAGEREGEHARLRAEIQSQYEIYAMARRAYDDEAVALFQIEELRPKERQWHNEQLSLLETGINLAGQPVPDDLAVKIFNYDEKGRLRTDPTGRPMMMAHPDKRLKPRAKLVAVLREEEQKIEELIKQIDKLVAEEIRLTFYLEGKPGEQKGLYGLLAELDFARKQSLAEADFVKPLRVTRALEAQSLMARRLQLLARIEELTRGVAANPQPE